MYMYDNLISAYLEWIEEATLTLISTDFPGITIIISTIILSFLGGLILFVLAQVLGKIKNATLFNSWALFCILSFIQFLILLLLTNLEKIVYIYLIFPNKSGWPISLFLYTVSIFCVLYSTKIFWRCTFKKSFITHLIPIFFLPFSISLLVIAFNLFGFFINNFMLLVSLYI